MPDDTPTGSQPFSVAVAGEGVLARPGRGFCLGADIPGSAAFVVWLNANGFAPVLWTPLEGAALDRLIETLAGRGIPEGVWTEIGLSPSGGGVFDAAVTAVAGGFPLVRVARNRVDPDWPRLRADLLARRAWREGGEVGPDPAAYLDPATAPVPRTRQSRTRQPAPPPAALAAALAASASSAPPASVEAALAEAALGPRQVTVDGQTVQSHDLSDLIEADRYLQSKKPRRGLGVGVTQMSHSGAT